MEVKGSLVKILDKKHGKLQLGASSGLSEEFLANVRTELEHSPIDAVAIKGQSVQIEDVQKDDRYPDHATAAREGLGAALVVPLGDGDRCAGVLHLYRASPGSFSSEENMLARTIAAQAVITLEKLQVLRQAQVLGEISLAISSTLDRSSILQTIVRQAAEVLDFKAASIRMLDDEGKYLQEEAAYGLSEAYLAKGLVELDKSPLDQAVLGGEQVTISDGQLEAKLQYPEQVRREGVKSILCLPLSIKGRAVGVLRVYSAIPHKFTTSEKEFLKALASQGAIAIENARLFEHLQRDYHDLTHAVWKWYDWGRRPPRM